MTWISQPLFNLLLRLSRYGRHALSTDQRRGANVVAVLAAPLLLCAGWWLIGGDKTGGLTFLALFYFGLLLLLPASAIYKCDAGWPTRLCMAAYTIGLASILPLSIAAFMFNRRMSLPFFQIHLYGCVLSGFVANALMMQRAKRHTAKALG